MSSKKQNLQLGGNYSTLMHHLRKSIMFDLCVQAGQNLCYQCYEPIEDIAEFSIEHKIPWLDSETPRELFFDLDNIAFSHLLCNTTAARRYKGPKAPDYEREKMYN